MCDFICEKCDKKFQRKEKLDAITVTKRFTTSANLYRHMKHSCKIKTKTNKSHIDKNTYTHDNTSFTSQKKLFKGS